MTRHAIVWVGVLMGLILAAWAPAAEVREIRLGRHPEFVRCVVEMDARPSYRLQNSSHGGETVSLEVSDVSKAPSQVDVAGELGFVTDNKLETFSAESQIRVHLRTTQEVRLETMVLENPWRLILDLYPEGEAAPALPARTQAGGAVSLPPPLPPLFPAALPASTQTVGADGFRPRIMVIDPGHGGHHRGGLGKVGKKEICEAEVTLPIAFYLERLLNADPMFTPQLTRRTDVYVGLRERTRRAEQANGNLFLSIHYNAVPPKSKSSARGMELWVWSMKDGGDTASKHLMTLDNEEGGDTGISDTSWAARNVLNNMMQDALLEQSLASQNFAKSLEKCLLRDKHFASDYRGIKSARFKVLENYNMPSVLLEVGFITNPAEAKLSIQSSFQEKTARLLYDGVVDYFMKTDPAFRAARGRQVAKN